MFCKVKGAESLGAGKVIDQAGGTCLVAYFSSPVEIQRETKRVPIASALRYRLSTNTRIYYLDPRTGDWSVGRVIEDTGDGVTIRFPDKMDASCDYADVFVRCKRSIDDPVAYLAKGITETPQYAEARSHFLASYIRQRGAAWGISALLSAVIELEAHQVTVVRRILSDPCQRYLLADEVGLGKTVEAGLVIRQAVLDDPRNHRILILVPNTLVPQWREELTRRFGLCDFLDDSIQVVAQETSVATINKLLTTATMLVVDEAHHVAGALSGRLTQLFDCLQAHARTIDRVLLLSATPVLRNETGFLRMLHLLDPVMYPLDDEVRFRDKIQHRQVLAESVAMLEPQQALFLDGILDELQARLPGDERLHELIAQLQPILEGVPDENDPALIDAIGLLRAHLSETYRLHRRILRNRRKRIQFVTPDRDGATPLDVPERQLATLEALIETWRVGACETAVDANTNELAHFHWQVLSALLSNPDRIPDLCAARLDAIRQSGAVGFAGEDASLKDIASAVYPGAWVAARIESLSGLISQCLTGRTKLVIFCSEPMVADAVYAELALRHSGAVVRYELLDYENENQVTPAIQFTRQDKVRIIICDRSAEEGLNLQGGSKMIIHFDLPIEPNRIEQRMGRVDRYGAGDPIKSFVLLDEGSRFQHRWYPIVASVLGVFDRSISSLQYLVEAELPSFVYAVFAEGLDAFTSLAQSLGGPEGTVAKELKLIDQQDALDELMPLAEVDLGDVFDVDADWQSIRDATTDWANDALLFAKYFEVQRVTDPIPDPPFRFRYQIPGHGGAATLIALSEFLDDFLGALDYEYPKSTSRQPMSYPHCARRQTAVRKSSRLMRYGDEFIEALKTFSDLDDRGRSYAVWRQIRSDFADKEPKFFFRFDFLIEVSLGQAEVALAECEMKTATACAAMKRRGDALFPPFVERIWVDEDGLEASADFVSCFLNLPYDKHGRDPRYVDTNLKTARLRALMEAAPEAFTNWDVRCARMREAAMGKLLARSSLAEAKKAALARARVEDEIRHAQLRARIQSMSGSQALLEQRQLSSEQAINAGLYQGIHAPSVKIDVAGVVLLSASPYPFAGAR